MQAIVSQGGAIPLQEVGGIARRSTPSGLVNPPLAVSAARGLAAVCAEQRVTVYDLAEADSEEEDGDGEDDGEAESDEDGMDDADGDA